MFFWYISKNAAGKDDVSRETLRFLFHAADDIKSRGEGKGGKNMTESFQEGLSKRAVALGVELTEVQLEKFFLYYERMKGKNKVMNLTSITEESDVVLKHFTDSLSLAAVSLPSAGDVSRETLLRNTLPGKRLIDVGTGAGFPGLALKIAFPELEVVLNDSLQKRLRFLNELIEELNLKGISCVHGRAEELAHERKWRGAFDFSVSRAVARLSVLSEYDLPFVKNGGYFLAMKAGGIEEELEEAKAAIRLLGGKLIKRESFILPESDIERSILLIGKLRESPSRYPRRAGIPSKEPLGMAGKRE